MKNHALPVLMTLGALLFASSVAQADYFRQGKNTCTTTDCNAALIQKARYDTLHPWVAHVFADAGECLRVSVIRQDADMEMAVLSPDLEENHWVDDDTGGSFRPLIKVDPTPFKGYYIVAVSHFVAQAGGYNFDVKYSRHPTGNMNCTNPTPASSMEAIYPSDDLDKITE